MQHQVSATIAALSPAAAKKAALAAYRRAYGRLHDMLSDMIEGGRLTEADAPDDYQALVQQLEACGAAETAARPAFEAI